MRGAVIAGHNDKDEKEGEKVRLETWIQLFFSKVTQYLITLWLSKFVKEVLNI